MALYLGVDTGGTESRWAAVDETGELVARGTSEGATGLIYDASSMAAFAGALEGIRDALSGPPEYAHFGITGAGFSQNVQVENQIKALFHLPPERFSYSNDMILAWHAAFDGQRGHLVSAGTGSIGVTLDPQGQPIVVGGRGILIDDGGSGTWIALRALDEVFRIIDQHGSPRGVEILADRLFSIIGGDDRDATRAYVYGKDRGRIGLLAMPVAEAAHAGDQLALNIILQAGRELVRLARALLARNGQARVSFIGRVIGLHPVIREVIQKELISEDIDFPVIDAPLHAARMALKKAETE